MVKTWFFDHLIISYVLRKQHQLLQELSALSHIVLFFKFFPEQFLVLKTYLKGVILVNCLLQVKGQQGRWLHIPRQITDTQNLLQQESQKLPKSRKIGSMDLVHDLPEKVTNIEWSIYSTYKMLNLLTLLMFYYLAISFACTTHTRNTYTHTCHRNMCIHAQALISKFAPKA